MTDKYIEQDGVPILELDLYTWAHWFETHDTMVAQTKYVSTIFLGVNHNMSGVGPPLLYETMVFCGDIDCDKYQERYATREDAELGHKRVVALVQKELERAT